MLSVFMPSIIKLIMIKLTLNITMLSADNLNVVMPSVVALSDVGSLVNSMKGTKQHWQKKEYFDKLLLSK
jgi:hypothetical protein